MNWSRIWKRAKRHFLAGFAWGLGFGLGLTVFSGIKALIT